MNTPDMVDSQLLPIALLYTNNRERIEGTTRLQKLVFLAQRETEAPENFDYKPAQYGPYSVRLARSMDLFIEKGLVERDTVRNELGNRKHVYSLTTKGIKLAKRMLEREGYEDLFECADEIKDRFNGEPLPRLLRYVYSNYEEFAKETELDTDRLFDPEAESEFLEPTSQESKINVDAYLGDPELFQNDDGTWTAKDRDHGLTALGSSRKDAREKLAEVIAAAQGEGGQEVTDDDLQSLGVDPETARDDQAGNVPEFMQ